MTKLIIVLVALFAVLRLEAVPTSIRGILNSQQIAAIREPTAVKGCSLRVLERADGKPDVQEDGVVELVEYKDIQVSSNRTVLIEVSTAVAKELSAILLSDASYVWSKISCEPLYHARVSFAGRSSTIDVDFCMGCEIVAFRRGEKLLGVIQLGKSANRVFEILDGLFPNDPVLKKIKDKQSERAPKTP